MLDTDRAARKALWSVILTFSESPEKALEEIERQFESLHRWDKVFSLIFGIFIGICLGVVFSPLIFGEP